MTADMGTLSIVLWFVGFSACVAKSGNVTCDSSNSKQCIGKINCDGQANVCWLRCIDSSSCTNTIFDCGEAHECGLNCNTLDACQNVTLVGTESRGVLVNWRIGDIDLIDETTQQMILDNNLPAKIYCPCGGGKCWINCQSSKKLSTCNDMEIFSKNGGMLHYDHVILC